MRNSLTGFGAALLLCTQAGAGVEERDPYSTPPPKGSVARLDYNAMFGEPGSEAAILLWLARNPKAKAEDRAILYNRLCSNFGVRSWHALRAQVCAEERALRAETDERDDDTAIASALKNTPPIRPIGSTILPLHDNAFGSKSANVNVNGIILPWLIDTGAEVTVLAQSNADRMNVNYVGNPVQVGTSTAPVMGRMAVIDLLYIGDAAVENVPVLVLPDKQLSIGNLPMIPAILGLPVMAAFGRVAWLDGGSKFALGEAAPKPHGKTERIFWHPKGLGISIATSRGTRGAHFDSGASSTYLFPSGLDLLTPQEEQGAIVRTVQTGGAGGIVEKKLRELPLFNATVAGAPVTLKDVTLAEDTDNSIARIGSDYVTTLRSLVIDFEQMSISAEAKPKP